MGKRGYKLQEFVAHASAVKCLSIGKKTSRLLVTGGEDHRVNLWAIGKPTSLLSLSGHTSSVESVTFDSAEVLVVSGASTGAIKLWDLEEAKIVRTLTGHTSHCNTVEFHPFGEFFASGSSDTNLKIWDVRKKGCIHTYKGHTRGVNTIRFTPDGRWVVSGGADSVVKVWDLTAGKLLHELKFHDGQIQCLDFHPLEFLLASGSADRTVNFWDLETFELIGSAGPEATGVRSMTFHPDGKTLFCGLEDSLKVFSWEPIICHDAVDMGWSTLCDLSIREGKLLACSFYRNCVGVWIADISLIGPYGTGIPHQSTGHMERKFDFPEMLSAEKPKSLVRSGTAVLPTAQDSDTDIRNIYVDTSASKKAAPKRIGTVHASKVASPVDSSEAIGPSPLKKGPEANMQTRSNSSRQAITVPAIVPRNNRNAEHAVNSRRESVTPESSSPGILLKQAHIGRTSNSKHEMDSATRTDSRCFSSKTSDLDSSPEPKFHFSFFPAKNEASEDSNDSHRSINNVTEKFERILTPDVPRSSSHNTSADPQSYNERISFLRPVSGADQLGRTRSLVERWEKREICSPPSTVPTEPVAPAAPIAPPAPAAPIAPAAPPAPIAPPAPTAPAAPIAPTAPAAPIAPPAPTVPTSRTMFAAPVGPTDEKPGSRTLLHVSKGEPETSGRSTCKSDEDVLEDLMRSHDTFSSTLRSRLTKLQVK